MKELAKKPSRPLRLKQGGLGYLTEWVQGHLELRRHQFYLLALPCRKDPGKVSPVHQGGLGMNISAAITMLNQFDASRQPHIVSRLDSVVIQWG